MARINKPTPVLDGVGFSPIVYNYWLSVLLFSCSLFINASQTYISQCTADILLVFDEPFFFILTTV
jgi:hypothetical protein